MLLASSSLAYPGLNLSFLSRRRPRKRRKTGANGGESAAEFLGAEDQVMRASTPQELLH